MPKAPGLIRRGAPPAVGPLYGAEHPDIQELCSDDHLEPSPWSPPRGGGSLTNSSARAQSDARDSASSSSGQRSKVGAKGGDEPSLRVDAARPTSDGRTVNETGSKVNCAICALADFLDTTDAELYKLLANSDYKHVGPKGPLMLDTLKRLLSDGRVLGVMGELEKSWNHSELPKGLSSLGKGDYLLFWNGLGHMLRARVTDEGLSLWDPQGAKSYDLMKQPLARNLFGVFQIWKKGESKPKGSSTCIIS